MGCGCKDKERDARILEYHYMKKAKQQGYPGSGTIVLTWEENILDIHMFEVTLEDVLSIRKIGERLYTATVLLNNETGS